MVSICAFVENCPYMYWLLPHIEVCACALAKKKLFIQVRSHKTKLGERSGVWRMPRGPNSMYRAKNLYHRGTPPRVYPVKECIPRLSGFDKAILRFIMYIIEQTNAVGNITNIEISVENSLKCTCVFFYELSAFNREYYIRVLRSSRPLI